MKPWIRICAGASAALLLSACSGKPTDIPDNPAPLPQKGELIEGVGRTEVLTKGDLSLSVDFDMLNVIVTDHRSNKEWSTNPLDADNDPVAEVDYLPRLKSQFTLSYLANRSVRNIDSFSECVEKEQFAVYQLENGVRIDYTLGDLSLTAEDIPQKLSAKRADSLILQNDTLSSDEKEYFTLCYEQNAQGVWEWKSNNFGSKVNDVLDLFKTISYTVDDLKADCAEFGLECTATEKIGFRVPITYTLENGVFRVSIAADEIEYPPDCPILQIDLCPYYGAATGSQPGYLFIPDGSGALIDFDSKVHRISEVELPIYSREKVAGKGQREQVTQPVLLPVYGLKSGENAFLAVVEEGEALGKIVATRAGLHSSYNAVGTSFTLSEQDSMDLSALSSGAAEVGVLQRNPYSGNLTIAYRFLNGTDAGYAGMARSYRQYLIDEKGYQKTKEQALPLYIETIGAVESNKNILGINYRGTTALTTYAESKEITDKLKKAGVDSVILRLSAWLNTGYEQTALNRFKPISALGDKEALADLLKSGNTYLNTTFLTAPSSKGLSLSTDVAKTIDQRYARTYLSVDNETLEPKGYILSVSRLADMVKTVTKGLLPYPKHPLSVSDLGHAVYADYTRGKEINRQQAVDMIAQQVSALEKENGRLMLEKPNARTAQYAGHIVDAPLSASGYLVADREVPFYAMVMHGLAGFAGSARNLSSTAELDLLKAAESGAGLSYTFTYKNIAAISGISNLELYAVYYKDWMENCVDSYIMLQKVLGDRNHLQITDHAFVTDHCTVTTYEDGTQIAVNYGNRTVSVMGRSVAARSFAVVKE